MSGSAHHHQGVGLHGCRAIMMTVVMMITTIPAAGAVKATTQRDEYRWMVTQCPASVNAR